MVAISHYVSKKSIKKSLAWTKKRCIKMSNFFNVLVITNLRISWLELLKVADWEPYNKKLTFSLPFNSKNLESTFSRFSKSSNLWWQRERNCSVVPTSLPHAHIAFTVSPKPCLNLCSFRWPNWSLRRVRSLTPSRS